MELYLLRHGLAEDPKPGIGDESRSLTTEGRHKLRRVLDVAQGAPVLPSLILASPFRRTMQTAELAADVLRYNGTIRQSKVLMPGSNPEQVWNEIRDHRDENSLLLVGHNPLFELLVGYILGSPNIRVNFKKGGLIKIVLDGFPTHPRGLLEWYLTPRLAER